ncbi:MAG: MarR family winged helix-turn-helix transcriptional regulator [Armatimonadota bacterium]
MDLHTALTGELLQFYNNFASWEQSVIRASDLTVAEAHAIEVLGRDGQMNMKHLARKLGVTTGTVTVTVDRLERKGYGQREAMQGDRRVHLIRLTEKGQLAYQEHHQYHQALTAQMLAVLTEEEATQLFAMLRKLNAEVL